MCKIIELLQLGEALRVPSGCRCVEGLNRFAPYCKEGPMAYLIWPMIGVIVAVVMGAGPRRRPDRPNTNSAFFAGAFGALVGGIIGDGVPQSLAGQLNLTSVIGAIVGALILCWAVRERASDTEV